MFVEFRFRYCLFEGILPPFLIAVFLTIFRVGNAEKWSKLRVSMFCYRMHPQLSNKFSATSWFTCFTSRNVRISFLPLLNFNVLTCVLAVFTTLRASHKLYKNLRPPDLIDRPEHGVPSCVSALDTIKNCLPHISGNIQIILKNTIMLSTLKSLNTGLNNLFSLRRSFSVFSRLSNWRYYWLKWQSFLNGRLNNLFTRNVHWGFD